MLFAIILMLFDVILCYLLFLSPLTHRVPAPRSMPQIWSSVYPRVYPGVENSAAWPRERYYCRAREIVNHRAGTRVSHSNKKNQWVIHIKSWHVLWEVKLNIFGARPIAWHFHRLFMDFHRFPLYFSKTDNSLSLSFHSVSFNFLPFPCFSFNFLSFPISFHFLSFPSISDYFLHFL